MRFRNVSFVLFLFAGALTLGFFPRAAAQPDPAAQPGGSALTPAPLPRGEGITGDAASFLPSPAKGKLADRIVAWVNETPVALTELEEALVYYRSQGLMPPGPTDETSLREALEKWIDDTLLFSAAEKMQIEISAESLDNRVEGIIRQAEKNHGGAEQLDRFLAAAGQDRAALRKQLTRWTRREWTIAQAVNSRLAVTDADVDRFVAERKKEGLPLARYRLSHLFIPVSSEAPPALWKEAEDRARRVIEAVGNRPFVEAAREYAAVRREEGVKGGLLGTVEAGDLKPPLAAAVEALQEGERSAPVRSAAGVHVLCLERKTTPREMLHARLFDEESRKWARQLRETATIQLVKPILQNIEPRPTQESDPNP